MCATTTGSYLNTSHKFIQQGTGNSFRCWCCCCYFCFYAGKLFQTWLWITEEPKGYQFSRNGLKLYLNTGLQGDKYTPLKVQS